MKISFPLTIISLIISGVILLNGHDAKGQHIAGGENFSLAVCQGAAPMGGTVWAWGKNSSGQLGDGTTSPPTHYRSNPVQVTGLSGIIAVSAGDNHSLALKDDGTVWAWGANGAGELGDSTFTTRLTPVQVHGLSGVIAISAGDFCSLALKSDGSVWAWGDNGSYELGDSTPVNRTTPVRVHQLNNIITLAAGDLHGEAVPADSTLWGWGYNFSGAIGDGTTIDRSVPVLIPGLKGVKNIAGGQWFTLVAIYDGSVWAWGDNSRGQLGDSTTNFHYSPGKINGFTGAVAVAAGYNFSLALKGDSTVWDWGSISGDSTGTENHFPVQVPNFTGVTEIAAGENHGLAIKDNAVWAWGSNQYDALGIPDSLDGIITTTLNYPAKVLDLCSEATPVKEKYIQNIISITPDPFSLEATLQTNKSLKNATLMVYNSIGQQVREIKNIYGQSVTLHRDNLPGGIYFIRLMENNRVFSTNKLIITNN